MSRLVSSARIPVGIPGLLFNGKNSYGSLGTMGSFGSSFAAGFYSSLDITSVDTNLAEFGTGENNSMAAFIQLNEDQSGANVPGKISLFIKDASNILLRGGTSIATNFNDGKKHTVTILAEFIGKTIIITVDGTPYAITYNSQGALSNFINFAHNFTLAARTFASNVPGNFFNGIINKFKIGTTPSTLFGNYALTESSGNTIADTSGQANTGTLFSTQLLNVQRISSI